MIAPSSAAADRAAVDRAGFPAFVELAGRYLHGKSYLHGRHIPLIAEHVEALFWGEILTLLVSIAPGTSKSFICSVLAPAWMWTRRADYRMICASYEQSLANFLANESKNLCTSDWYRDRWGDHVLPQDFAEWRKRPAGTSEFWTADGGFRFSVGVKQGRGVGRHGHLYLVDDPIKSQALADEGGAVLTSTRKWFKSTAVTRGKIGEEQRILAVAQRLHVEDLNGLIADMFADDPKFAHLCLPWHYEPERKCVTVVGQDFRTTPGEALQPADAKTVRAANIALKDGPTAPEYRAQYQQDPNSARSEFFPPESFLGFEDFPDGPPAFAQSMGLISIDPTFCGKPRSDFMAVDVWGFLRGRFVCFYSEWVRREFDDALDTIRLIRSQWKATHIVCEAAANGFAIANRLQKELVGFLTQAPKGSKEQRAKSASLFARRGLVHYDKAAPWYAEKARYMQQFPNGSHDDMVDTATQAINWLAEMYGGSAIFEEAMAAIQSDTDANRLAAQAQEFHALQNPLVPPGVAGQMSGFAARIAETYGKHPDGSGLLPELAPVFGDMTHEPC